MPQAIAYARTDLRGSPPALDSRDRFVGFAFAAADLLAEIDAARSLTFVAGSFRERFGCDAEKFLGKQLSCLIAPEDQAGLEIALSVLASRGRLTPISLRLDNPARTVMAVSGLHLPNNAGVSWLTMARLPAEPAAANCVATGPLFREAIESRLKSADACGMGLVEVGGWSRLEPERRRALEASIAAAMREAGGEGALAAEMADGRFGVLGDADIDMAELQASIGNILRAAGAARPVSGTGIPLKQAGDFGSPESMRAMRYAMSCFASSGVAAVRRAGFDSGLRGFLERTEARAAAVRGAIERNRFRLVYQPVVSLSDRQVHHFEALIRPFPIEGHESESTQDFVTFAEAVGLAEVLDSAVLHRTAEALRQANARVAINVSGISMQSQQFRKTLLSLIGNEAMLCERLMIELTETADIDDVPAAVDTVNKLAAAGVPVCLDDFGAGFAAFRYLREFKVDFVKIDGSFVRHAGAGARESGFITAMADLARCVGADTIAEMIETEAQAQCMLGLGVRYGQGWLFGRPGGLPGSL
jgi:EAL domain-containing protein (putative c-di-GMP-specific phosphodiesterase class I)